jgi:predicted transporter
MPVRLRKFIGMIMLVTMVLVYVFVVAVIAVFRLAEASALVQFVYFAFTGLFWVLPAMLIVKWMEKPEGR